MALLQVMGTVICCRCIHTWRPQLMKQLNDLTGSVDVDAEMHAV
jgi:hypothetical protein